MTVLTNPSRPLPGRPRDIVVTDWTFYVSQADQDAIYGEVWFDSDLGPSSVYITMMEFGENDRVYGFARDRECIDRLDELVEHELNLAIQTKLAGIVAVRAPVFTKSPGPEWGPQPSVVTSYVCPYCGANHSFVQSPERQFHEPDCGGLTGTLLRYGPLPPVFPGKPINLEHFAMGVARVRLSRTILKEVHKP